MKRPLLAALLALGLIQAAVAAETFAQKKIPLKPVHYSLDLALDVKSHKVSGHCLLTVINASSQPCTTVPLILYRLLKVTSVRSADGRGLVFQQRVVSFEDWETIQANFVEVELGASLAPDASFQLDIDYDGYILGYAESGMLYVKDKVDEDFTIIRTDCLAYPELGYPSWKANTAAGLPDFEYDLRVTAPKGLVVANGGKFLGLTTKGDMSTSSYKSLKPSWRIDVAVAKYRMFEDSSRNLRVFSLEPGDTGAQAVLLAASRSMALFASWFGPLRGESAFTIIEIPAGFGGQADATCVLFTPEPFRDKSKQFLLYHEISHLWNVKSLDPLPPRFESEGLAMFLQYFAQEKLEGQKDALSKAEERMLDSLREDFAKNPSAAQTAMIDYGRADLTELSYTKGMLFFDLLYRLMGEKDFLASLASFSRDFGSSGATAHQFLDHLAARSRVPLDRLFREWVTGTDSSSDILKRLTFNEILNKYRSHKP